MRALLAAVLVASCATAVAPPPNRLAGCWIDRKPDNTAVTMRWLPDPEVPGALRGDRMSYTPQGVGEDRGSYTLRQEAGTEAWMLCNLTAERCWQVAEGESGSLEGGRAFIDATRERLRISLIDGAVERIIFQGARDGCD